MTALNFLSSQNLIWHNLPNTVCICVSMCNSDVFSKIKQLILAHLSFIWASLVAQMVKSLPAMWETQV